MKYATLHQHHMALRAEAAELDAKKRLGKNQKARRAAIDAELSQATQPPARHGGHPPGNAPTSKATCTPCTPANP